MKRSIAVWGLVVAGCAQDPSYKHQDAGAAGAGGGSNRTCPADAALGVSAIDGGLADGGLRCESSCEFGAGVPVGCATRFHYGVNYAWSQFAGDFGGISVAWSAPGVSRSCRIRPQMADMRAHGVDVVRWWVWPDFRGDGVVLDANGTPTGLGGTTLADIEAALALAAEAGIRIQFCLFSFDNFKPDGMIGTKMVRGIRSIVRDPGKRAALMSNVVRPFARAVTASSHADRVVAWDVINEPEWAITGSDPYGDPPFDPQSTLEVVSHAEMEIFIRDVMTAIRQESYLPMTVGSAAAKWSKAWSGVGVDFHSIHIYDWVNRDWPYSASPAQLGLGDKPVVMGEFPLGGLTGVPYQSMLESWYANGYAGALGWAVSQGGNNSALHWAPAKANVKAFADAKGCTAAY